MYSDYTYLKSIYTSKMNTLFFCFETMECTLLPHLLAAPSCTLNTPHTLNTAGYIPSSVTAHNDMCIMFSETCQHTHRLMLNGSEVIHCACSE